MDYTKQNENALRQCEQDRENEKTDIEECTMDIDCDCEDCQKENIKMD